MMSQASRYAATARQNKALKLASILRQSGINSSQASDITPEDWRRISQAIGVNTPSPETCGIVISLLAFAEETN